MTDSVFLTKVTLKNFKSIASCSVDLHPLMFLVGLNGAGKSNFLDALRFVSDALSTSLDHAIRQRNGIGEVRRRSGGHPTYFSIRLDFRLPSGVTGHYGFRIGSRPQGGFEVQSENCQVKPVNFDQQEASFEVKNGQVKSSEKLTPAAVTDRLYLVSASSLPPFRPVFDLLSRMAIYNLNPARIRDLQTPDAGEILSRDGDNIASVLATISRQSPDAKTRIEEYLAEVVPGVKGVDTKVLGPKETLEFRQEVLGAAHPWHFLASSMSDGTLRALGVLVALFQSGSSSAGAPLIGIEEPEVALHPAAVGVLLDSLQEASARRQILITSHSADLLENKSIIPEMLLAVEARRGVTLIAPIDKAGQTALRDHLYTAGELLRLGQLTPDPIDPALTVLIPNPAIRVPRSSIIKPGELERSIQLAAFKLRFSGGILVLVDSDEDCPATLGPVLLARAKAERDDIPIAVVLAKQEFEAWFLAAAASLRGRQGLSETLSAPSDPEEIGGAKEWLRRHMASNRKYSPTVDQPELTRHFDLNAAQQTPSFDKLCRDIAFLVEQLR